MKKTILFVISVFFSQNSFSADKDLEVSAPESSSISDETPMNALVLVEKTDSEIQFPKFSDELHDQIPSFSCKKNRRVPASVLVKNFKKQNTNFLRRNMFKRKYDQLFWQKYVELHFDSMQGGSFNIDINQKSDDDMENGNMEEDYNFGDDDFPSMEDIDYFSNLEEELF